MKLLLLTVFFRMLTVSIQELYEAICMTEYYIVLTSHCKVYVHIIVDYITFSIINFLHALNQH